MSNANVRPPTFTGLVGPGQSYLGAAITKPEDSTALAKNIFDRYDKDRGGNLGYSEIVTLMVDMYRSINKSFTPTRQDVEGFTKLLDVNKDGKIDMKDLDIVINKTLKIDTSVDRTVTTSVKYSSTTV